MSLIRKHSMKPSRGTILIVAMWITLVLGGLVLVFARAMRAEVATSANQLAELQAESVARAAVQFIFAEVDRTEGQYVSDTSVTWQGMQVGDGYFWVLNPSMEDDTGYFFGLRDEASRINLNTASTDMLLKLPRSTSELAASIVDWRDRDDDVTTGGAESGYYLLLADPYYCKNGPFETVEELLLVKGADTTLLYGEDTNRNGLLDANENDATDTDPPDNRDGRLDRGVLDYLTVYSREENLSSTGEARINVNDANSASALRTLLNNVMAQEKSLQVMSRVRGGRPFRNVLDFYFRTGLTLDEFTQIADQLATGTDRVLTGLLDVNTAPRPVLLCLPGLEASDVDALISKRQASDADLTSIAWVAGALPQEKAVAIGSLITARSYQFSADIVAASGNGRAFRRYKAIIDASAGPPKVVFWKDVTHLGWPLDPTILATLRAGKLVAPSVGIATGGGS